MPRIARNQYNGKIFHITVKGINSEYIFDNNEDKTEYLKLLHEKKININIKILAYCIMNNHAHILLKCEEISEISEFMKKVNTAYAIFYNKKYDREGYVFKNRFYSQSIIDRKHLLSCITYIHRNPVKANIVKNMNAYSFSSYNEYFYKNKNVIISKDDIIRLICAQYDEPDWKKFREYHLKRNLIEYEFDEKINYQELISDYKKYYTDREIIEKLLKQFNCSKQKVAEFMKTTVYDINKIVKK